METYGFIYLWYDSKHKRYYLGRHWGTETDGYISSSNNMRMNYKNRPHDFKRRIISKIYSSNEDLVIEEQRWLNMISDNHLNERYYNKTKSATTPSTRGYKHSPETIEKIKFSNTGKKRSEELKQKLREANRKQFEDQEQREMRRQKSLELWSNPEYRKVNSENKKGIKQSEEHIQKRSNSLKNRWKTQPKKGFKKSDEEKLRIAKMTSDSMWINNGNINKRIPKNSIIPNGFMKGRCKRG